LKELNKGNWVLITVIELMTILLRCCNGMKTLTKHCRKSESSFYQVWKHSFGHENTVFRYENTVTELTNLTYTFAQTAVQTAKWS